MAEFSINYEAFDRELKEFSLVMRRDSAEVVKQQAKLFVRDVVKLTPPTGNAPFTESFAAQRQAGLKAVEQDIRHAFVEIQELNIADKKLEQNLKDYARREEITKIQTVLKRLKLKGTVIEAPTEAIHNKLRNRRGRVSRARNLVLRRGTVKPFIKMKQALVGTAKSGWAKACAALGVSLPAWIREKSGPGVYDARLTGPAPQITVGDTVGYIQEAGARLTVIQRALNRRAESMRNQIDKVMGRRFRGYKGRAT
jgi:hypothetical protein